MNPLRYDLHLVTDRHLTLGRSLTDIVQAAVAGGVNLVQLREKNCTTREFIELGQALKQLLRPYHVPLIINDRVDVALAVGAAGVHVGQSDMPSSQVRQLLGPQALIGLSVESVEDACAAERFDVDYLGISPVFVTPTKGELTRPLGLEGVRQIRAATRHRLVAIGGINSDNAAAVVAAGADGLAVVSAICSAPDPQTAADCLRRQINSMVQPARRTIAE